MLYLYLNYDTLVYKVLHPLVRMYFQIYNELLPKQENSQQAKIF